MSVAVIDLGSNTMRLCVYEMRDGHIETLFREKEAVGLAGYVRDNRLSIEGISKLCETLSSFKQLALHFVPETEIKAFATASLRYAVNRDDALEAISKCSGITPAILSGEEEAFLDFVGVSHFTGRESGFLTDIGGASTELVRYTNGMPMSMESLPMGCLSLYVKHAKNATAGHDEKRAMRKEIRELFDKFDWASTGNQPVLIGVGGTCRSAVKLSRELFGGDKKAHVIPADNIKIIRKMLETRGAEVYQAVYKAAPERALTIYPGMLILEEVIKRLGCEELSISEYGVREGYFIKYTHETQMNSGDNQ